MSLEAGRQLSFLSYVETPYTLESPTNETRTLLHALNEDFTSSINFIRTIYLPENSVLRNNSWLLDEALETVPRLDSLFGKKVNLHPSMNLALAANLNTLRCREIFLNNIQDRKDLPLVVHTPNTPEWENEIRASTDNQFQILKSSSPEDKLKRTESWTGASTQAIWQTSTVFHPNQPSADLADRIAGEDWLSANMFIYYFSFLKRKAADKTS